VRSLRERGALLGFHAEVDLASVSRGLQAMIAVWVRPPTRAVIKKFQAFVARMPEVISVFVLTAVLELRPGTASTTGQRHRPAAS
jgi:DNA-binding Lrp family transcriptional regulator